MASHLYNESLGESDFLLSRPWNALLYWPSDEINAGSEAFGVQGILGINDLLDRCREFRRVHGDELVLYFRGESRCFPHLRPSVMRLPRPGENPLRSVEGEMLDDLMTRQPEAFGGMQSALAQWVMAQHHGLRTRLLDITRNPLVALYNGSSEHSAEDGRLHVFGVPKVMIKPFNSDTASALASFAKLSRTDQAILLGKAQADDPSVSLPANPADYLLGNDPFSRARAHLYSIIRQEKPYFEERLDIRDLFRVICRRATAELWSESRRNREPFLLSAFHERFECVARC